MDNVIDENNKRIARNKKALEFLKREAEKKAEANKKRTPLQFLKDFAGKGTSPVAKSREIETGGRIQKVGSSELVDVKSRRPIRQDNVITGYDRRTGEPIREDNVVVGYTTLRTEGEFLKETGDESHTHGSTALEFFKKASSSKRSPVSKKVPTLTRLKKSTYQARTSKGSTVTGIYDESPGQQFYGYTPLREGEKAILTRKDAVKQAIATGRYGGGLGLAEIQPARTPTTMSGLAMEWSREALTHEEWHGARYLASGSLGALAGGLGFVEGTAGLIGAGAYKITSDWGKVLGSKNKIKTGTEIIKGNTRGFIAGGVLLAGKIKTITPYKAYSRASNTLIKKGTSWRSEFELNPAGVGGKTVVEAYLWYRAVKGIKNVFKKEGLQGAQGKSLTETINNKNIYVDYKGISKSSKGKDLIIKGIGTGEITGTGSMGTIKYFIETPKSLFFSKGYSPLKSVHFIYDKNLNQVLIASKGKKLITLDVFQGTESGITTTVMKGATDLALNKNNIIAYSKSYELTDDIKIKGVNVLDQNSLNKIIVSRKEPITGRLFPAKSGQLTNIDADKYLFSLKTVRQPLNLKIGKAGTVLAQKSRVINIFPPAIADAGLKFTQRGGSLMGLTIIPLISGNVAGGPIQVTQDKQIIKENHINAVPAPEIKTFRNLNLAPISTIKPETPNKLIPLGLEIGIKTNLKRGIIPQMNTRISERITTKFTPPPPQINITPPPPTPIVPPSNFLGTIKPGGKKGSKSRGFANLTGKYSPSLTAVLFNIKTTKTPRYTSGLAIQPIKIKL